MRPDAARDGGSSSWCRGREMARMSSRGAARAAAAVRQPQPSALRRPTSDRPLSREVFLAAGAGGCKTVTQSCHQFAVLHHRDTAKYKTDSPPRHTQRSMTTEGKRLQKKSYSLAEAREAARLHMYIWHTTGIDTPVQCTAAARAATYRYGKPLCRNWCSKGVPKVSEGVPVARVSGFFGVASLA